MLDLLLGDEEEPIVSAPAAEAKVNPDRVKDVIARYFAESEPGHRANVSTLGHMLMNQFPEIQKGWAGHSSLSQLLKRLCGLSVEQVENRTWAWKDEGGQPSA